MKHYYQSYFYFFIILLTFSTGCKDPNPSAPLTEDEFYISVELVNSDQVAGNIMVTNKSEIDWEETKVHLTIKELESGKETDRNFELGSIEAHSNKNGFF